VQPTADKPPIKPNSGSLSRRQSLNEGREDVDRLCRHLLDRIVSNGSKRPTVTEKWRDAARLMLDRDGRSEAQVHKAIDWCQDSEFWRSNILSMPTLRDKYETLRLQAQRPFPGSQNGDRPATTTQRVQSALHRAARYEQEESA
jgi:hypothetical protein